MATLPHGPARRLQKVHLPLHLGPVLRVVAEGRVEDASLAVRLAPLEHVAADLGAAPLVALAALGKNVLPVEDQERTHLLVGMVEVYLVVGPHVVSRKARDRGVRAVGMCEGNALVRHIVALEGAAKKVAEALLAALVGARGVRGHEAAAVLHELVERLALGVRLEELVVGDAKEDAARLLHRVAREHGGVVRNEAAQAVRREVAAHLLCADLGGLVVKRAFGHHFACLGVAHVLPARVHDNVGRRERRREIHRRRARGKRDEHCESFEEHFFCCH